MARSLMSRYFGSLPIGEPVFAWTLTGESGLAVEAITFGGIVIRLLFPDRHGNSDDLVLGFDDLNSYLAGHPHFGAITGRVAGRISNARFELDGKTYNLARNDGANHLHGGVRGFDKRIWNGMPATRADGAPSLRLTYVSEDGEEGYPGCVAISVTYTVTDDNVFLIETEAVADKATPFRLTHHGYFNLAGEGSGSIEDHVVQIESDAFIPTDESLTLLDRLEPVDGRPEDLRSPRLLADAIPSFPLNHGAAYIVPRPVVSRPDEPGNLVRIAQVTHPASGRVLTCSTNESHLQFYTGSALDGTHVGKSGKPYAKYAGLCLECEGYANGANAPHIGDIVLRPGAPHRRTTAYAFSNLRANTPFAPGETQ